MMQNTDTNDETFPDIFNQNCAYYLRSQGIDCSDGEHINAPYRKDADSESFVTHGPFFNDYSHGISGNVGQLALLMNGKDRQRALLSLAECAGVALPSCRAAQAENRLLRREQAEHALAKVHAAFPIDESTPQNVLGYLDERKAGETARNYLSYIPKGRIREVLNDQEAEMTGLGYREGLLVLWYFRFGRPVYYCTRDIAGKDFKKAPAHVLNHPIWNADALYEAPTVVWGEGFFDVLSLMELGYGAAGEITCWPSKAHHEELLKALRWRHREHPDWRFIICLDNDALTRNGRRPGNEAAERLARRLWANGLDVHWVKHDPTAEKVDINQMHQEGREKEVLRMIESAKPLSEIYGANPDQAMAGFSTCMNHGDYRGAERFAEILGKSDGGSKIPQIAKRFFSDRRDWREFYDGIDAMFLWQDTVYVIHDWNQYGQGERHYDVFRKTALIDNIRRFQRNPALTIDWKMLDIPSRRPTYRVSRNRGRGDEPTFNLFRPSPMLLQKPELSPWSMRLPEQWDLLLNNLAGVDEKEWLLNHMVTYVQTLEKPRTIPVLVGKQGTGKNTLFELFGRGIGGFIAVGNEIMESQFNDWLLNPVILLDEFFTDSRDTRKLKNKLKSLINEEQTVNIKHEKLITCRINNYIAMASNEYVTAAPVIVERRDRRYTIITGGKDTDLEMDPDFNYDELERQLPDFMLYLLSKAADVGAANRPLMNDARERLMEMMEDERLVAVREWVDQHRSESAQPVTQKAVMRLINLECDFRCPLTAQKLRPIIEELGVETKRIDNQWYYMGIRLPSHSGREEGPSPTSETENTWGRTPKKCLSLKI